MKRARAEGLKVGQIRPITLWPFPDRAITNLSKRIKLILVFEMSTGQMIDDVRLAIHGRIPCEFYGRPGVWWPRPRRSPASSRGLASEGALMKKVFSRPASLKPAPFHYCPGCGHSIIHRLFAELIDDMDLGAGPYAYHPPAARCSPQLFRLDVCESAHGRGVRGGDGIKRSLPDRFVFTYKGDGDMAAIGTAETIHAANRGELITSIFVNNAVYGMTGGQMAPTTMIGQKTTTSPLGRPPTSRATR